MRTADCFSASNSLWIYTLQGCPLVSSDMQTRRKWRPDRLKHLKWSDKKCAVRLSYTNAINEPIKNWQPRPIKAQENFSDCCDSVNWHQLKETKQLAIVNKLQAVRVQKPLVDTRPYLSTLFTRKIRHAKFIGFFSHFHYLVVCPVIKIETTKDTIDKLMVFFVVWRLNNTIIDKNVVCDKY